MEHQKLISMVIAKFKIAYPYYFKELSDEEFFGLIAMYQEELSNYNELTLARAVKTIIRTRKFMPTLTELIEECENSKSYRGNEILLRMKEDGYFKRGVIELDEVHATKNYEKALMFMAKGIIPSWLLEDMKKYGYIEDKPLLENVNTNLIGIKG